MISVVGVLSCAGLFFVLARPRIGSLALLPTVVLLFLGTSWNTVVSPIGIPYLFSVAFGLAALVALERGGRRGDIAACVLITLAVASFSFGLVFLVGVAVWVLIGEDRLKRVWVFAVPLALYVLWRALVSSATAQPETIADPSNVLGLPLFAFLSLGVLLVSITGLNLELGPGADPGFNRLPQAEWALAPVVTLAAIVVLVVVVRRRGRPRTSFWVFLAVLGAFWLSIGLSAGPGRQPTTERYIFPGSVILLLVAVELGRGVRLSRPVLVGLLALTTLSVAVNIVHVREAREFLTAYATNARSTLAMVELGGERVDPAFRPGRQGRRVSPVHIGVSAQVYLRGVANWGSPAATLGEVRAMPRAVRGRADVVLARSLGLGLVPVSGGVASDECTTVRLEGRRATSVKLPPGGAVLRRLGGGGDELAIRRFGESFSASAGNLAPGRRMLLEIPRDGAPEPWQVLVGEGGLEVCAPPTSAARAQRYCEIARRLEASSSLNAERSRALLAELAQVAPPEIEAAVKTTIGSAILGRGGSRAAIAAQGRIDRFEAARCGA